MTPVTYTNTDVCQNRHGGNAESVAAYEAGKAKHPKKRQLVLDHIASRGHQGATSHEIAQALGWGLNAVSPRLSELKKKKIIEKSGTRGGAAVHVLVASEVKQ